MCQKQHTAQGNIFGLTALRGLLPLARHLISCGADVNAVDAAGYSPLLCARCFGHARMAALLLSAGAEPFAR